jgi:enoyl-CoA hydratase/carnithine racemase
MIMRYLAKLKTMLALAVSALALASPASAAGEAGVGNGDAAQAVAKAAPSSRIRLVRKSDRYWKVTFANPPLNLIGPAEVQELSRIIDQLEADPRVQVVVFDSAIAGSFINHYDLGQPLEASTSLKPGPTGMHPVPDFMVRLSKLPAISIVSIRGRASGIGSELALAADMRFASREKAILSQFEVGAGFVPGGGPMARLPRLVGRGRAMEILIGADDFDADTAERYGYINRSLPDDQLDGFVDALATRIASFDRHAIAETKKLVDLASMPPDAEMQPGWDAFIESVQRPAAQSRLQTLVKKGLQTPGDVEQNLGRHTAAYRPPSK